MSFELHSACNTKNLIILTNEPWFELDDIASQIVLRIDKGSGMARFANPNKMTVSVANNDMDVLSIEGMSA